MTTIRDEWVRARRPHHCELCAERIQVGERHRVWVGRDGGELISGRMHAECMAVTEIDRWDYIDWEEHHDSAGFRDRRQQLRDAGKLGVSVPIDNETSRSSAELRSYSTAAEDVFAGANNRLKTMHDVRQHHEDGSDAAQPRNHPSEDEVEHHGESEADASSGEVAHAGQCANPAPATEGPMGDDAVAHWRNS